MIWLLAHSTHRKTEKETQLSDGGLRGWAKSRIIRMQESLVLYKSFNTLWNHPSLGGRGAGGGGLYIMLEECMGPSMGSRHGANTPPESGVGGANPRVGGASYKPSCQNILNLDHPIHTVYIHTAAIGTCSFHRYQVQQGHPSVLGTIYILYIYTAPIGTPSCYRCQVQQGRFQPWPPYTYCTYRTYRNTFLPQIHRYQVQ